MIFEVSAETAGKDLLHVHPLNLCLIQQLAYIALSLIIIYSILTP